MSQVQLRSITAEEMRIGAAGVTPLPVEQSAIWEQYEAVEGRKLWGRLEYCEEGKRIALVALNARSALSVGETRPCVAEGSNPGT